MPTGAQKTRLIKRVAQELSAPLLRYWPVEQWPARLGVVQEVEAPSAAVPNPTRSPRGGAQIKILLQLLHATSAVEGDVAECGVFRGGTLVPMALYLKQHGINKHVWGFDSFEGFDQSVSVDLALGGEEIRDKRLGGLNETSYEYVSQKVARFGLQSNVTLVQGYFEDSLPRPGDRRMSFVHLDCDLYQSYKTCLEFFYPRLAPGAIVLLDEYNDPPWPGCNKAVDEFLAAKPERLVEIESDNYQKWYFSKQ
jgi:hypothetical protein